MPIPILPAWTAARDTGADRVELYTGPYGACHDDSAKAAKQLERLGKAADAALAAGLAVNAGHDLTVANLPALGRRIPGACRGLDRTWLDGRRT